MAERTEFIGESNEAEDQLFDYDFGWELCQKEWDEIVVLTEEADKTRQKYYVDSYIEKPTKELYKILDANRDKIEEMFDIYTMYNVLWANYTCQELKSEGFFGLEHKEE